MTNPPPDISALSRADLREVGRLAMEFQQRPHWMPRDFAIIRAQEIVVENHSKRLAAKTPPNTDKLF